MKIAPMNAVSKLHGIKIGQYIKAALITKYKEMRVASTLPFALKSGKAIINDNVMLVKNHKGSEPLTKKKMLFSSGIGKYA